MGNLVTVEDHFKGVRWDNLPAWVRDNEVLRHLYENGIKVEIVYDRKYLTGRADTPLVVCRGKIVKRPKVMSF